MTAPTMTAADSWAVVERAKAGDRDAFARIYEQYRDTVFRYVQFRVPNRATAEDVAQDTWVKALRSIGGVSYQGVDFGAWLTTIARNVINDHFRSGHVRMSTPVEDMHTWDLTAADDPEAETVAAIEARTAELLVGSLLPELTPEQQAVVRLRFYAGLSTVETAAALSRNVGAVKAAQYRATDALRRKLAEVAR